MYMNPISEGAQMFPCGNRSVICFLDALCVVYFLCLVNNMFYANCTVRIRSFTLRQYQLQVGGTPSRLLRGFWLGCTTLTCEVGKDERCVLTFRVRYFLYALRCDGTWWI